VITHLDILTSHGVLDTFQSDPTISSTGSESVCLVLESPIKPGFFGT